MNYPARTTLRSACHRLLPIHAGLTSTGKICRSLAPYLLIAPAVLLMLGGLVMPMVQAGYISLQDWQIGQPLSQAVFTGWANYSRMLHDPDVWMSLWVTLQFGCWTISIEMLLGISLALLMERSVRGASIFRTIFVLPLMVSPVVVGLVWRYLFDARIGWINFYLGSWFGIEPQVWLGDPELAFIAIVVASIWQWTPFVFIIVLAGLQGLPTEIIEAARIDGANWWQQILLIKLPMIRSILMITLLLRIIDVFRALELVYIMTGGGPGRATELLSLHIYKRAFDAQLLGYAAAISVLLIAFVTMISMLVLQAGSPLEERSDG